MQYYVDIRLRPDIEFSASMLMQALFAKLHRALGQYAEGQIGLSFPENNAPKIHEKNPKPVKHYVLGSLVRLHGQQEHLQQFMQQPWLQSLHAYCDCSAVQPIPSSVQHRTVKRVQIKTQHNKRERAIRKAGLSEEAAYQKHPTQNERVNPHPFIELQSLSNKNRMRIYIHHGALQDSPTQGTFSSYGLSSKATIPWF